MNQPAPTVLFGQSGQSLVFDCPEGTPTSVTSVTVQDESQADTGTTESATTGSATIDSAAATLDAAAGASESDAAAMVSTSAVTDFVVGRRYLVTSARGWVEFFELLGKDAGTKTLYARTPLQRDYAVGDAVTSPRLSIGLSSSWVADTSKLSGAQVDLGFPWMGPLQLDWYAQLSPRPRWRVEWVYVVGTTTYRHASYFDLVRYPLDHGVTAQDVDRLSRGFLQRLAVEDRGDGAALIAEALQQVKLDLWERDLAAYALRGNEVIHELVKLKAVALVFDQAFAQGGAVDAARATAHDAYWKRIDALLGAVPRVQVQVSSDGSTGTPEVAPLWRR